MASTETEIVAICERCGAELKHHRVTGIRGNEVRCQCEYRPGGACPAVRWHYYHEHMPKRG
jgi:predicted amidophosphoribosyltransferase